MPGWRVVSLPPPPSAAPAGAAQARPARPHAVAARPGPPAHRRLAPAWVGGRTRPAPFPTSSLRLDRLGGAAHIAHELSEIHVVLVRDLPPARAAPELADDLVEGAPRLLRQPVGDQELAPAELRLRPLGLERARRNPKLC